VKKSNGTLYWTGPGWDPLLETDLSGNATEEYVFFNGERVARVDMPANTVEYYFSDHLKSTDIVANATGGIVRESDYVPYGGEVVISGTDPNHYKFTGKERDPESGLDDFEARHYSSAFGRFMQVDEFTGGPRDLFGPADPPGPLPYADIFNPQSLNKYSYTYNNPLRYIDPDGHDVTFANLALAQQTANMAVHSETLSQELNEALMDPTMDAQVLERGFKVNEQKSRADTTVSVTDSNGVTHVKIFVDVWTNDDQIKHEWGHEAEARKKGGTKFVEDATRDQKEYPKSEDHNQRQVEKTADSFQRQGKRQH